MAFPVPLAGKLSGATRSQLAHWRRTNILVPEVRSSGRPLLYSFRDIAALRAFARLRQEASLQQIRKALNSLHALDMFEHPSAYRLAREGGTIVLQRDDSKPVDLVRHPGQILIANFEDVLSEFENIAGERVVDLRRPGKHLQVEPERLGGWPTIEGTRVPFDAVADLIDDGSVSADQVGYYYPEVSTEAAMSALEFARSLREPHAA
ncbi:DUF433 domain-containing protein [Leifsonia poae]|uniref:DUF433 domain-containing protein n=1 Tax=Leifsonia poae TaxID=110933 RepID=UPI003D69287C